LGRNKLLNLIKIFHNNDLEDLCSKNTEISDKLVLYPYN
jgi:hypothetical protein